MQEIALSHPLKVNGKEIEKLKCDLEAITVDQFADAEMMAKKKKGADSLAVMEFDYTFHLFLGFEGVIAAQPEIDMSDLERLSGTDVMKVMQAGRFFINGSDVGSTEDASDEQSESTQGNTGKASAK